MTPRQYLKEELKKIYRVYIYWLKKGEISKKEFNDLMGNKVCDPFLDDGIEDEVLDELMEEEKKKKYWKEGCGVLFQTKSGIVICGEERVDGNKFLCPWCLKYYKENEK